MKQKHTAPGGKEWCGDAQVVVDAIPPEVLVSRCATKLFDFERMDDDDLEDIVVPLDLPISASFIPTRLPRPIAPLLYIPGPPPAC